jgi:hypothetical protein
MPNQDNQDLGATALTRSETWGLVWRADRRDRSSNGPMVDRVICWLTHDGEESHLAFYWNVSPLIPTDVHVWLSNAPFSVVSSAGAMCVVLCMTGAQRITCDGDGDKTAR